VFVFVFVFVFMCYVMRMHYSGRARRNLACYSTLRVHIADGTAMKHKHTVEHRTPCAV